MTETTHTTEGTRRLAAVVLAAGEGTRMRSERAKVLHEVLGRPMVRYPVEAARRAGADRVVVVVGHQQEAVAGVLRGALEEEGPDDRLVFVEQPERRGTADAVRRTAEAVAGFDEVLILCGDTPALDGASLRGLVDAHREADATLTLLAARLDEPAGYGRVLRGESGAVEGVVEHRDATEAQRAIPEVNTGVYLARRDALFEALERVGSDNAQGELYLPDVVALTAAEGRRVRTHALSDPELVLGVNDRVQLARVEEVVLARRREALMRAGVTLQQPDTVRIEPDVAVDADAVIGPGVQLHGRTHVGAGARVEAGCVLEDTVVGPGARLMPYVVADGARVEAGASAGPFAHLRTRTVLREGARVGNFVETKKTTMAPGSKANHLAYLGDAEVGRGTNVGAGTITCNYDGISKHRTEIEDEVFIGSDVQLVAPVRLGRRATIAAGATITRDVPAGALALTRVSQTHKDDYDERYRRPREEAKRGSDR